jgi:hypothetical protein
VPLAAPAILGGNLQRGGVRSTAHRHYSPRPRVLASSEPWNGERTTSMHVPERWIDGKVVAWGVRWCDGRERICKVVVGSSGQGHGWLARSVER